MNKQDFIKQIDVNNKPYTIFDITILEEKGLADIQRLPFSIKILVENLLRKMDGHVVKEGDVLNIARWQKTYEKPVEIPYHPARVLMQDFTGVPAVVDLAAMREAVKTLGGDPKKINPLVPAELIIDHSVQIDYFGTSDSLRKNVAKEYERNSERYKLLKWAQTSFDNFKVVPPNSGICHQINLEHLGRVVMTEEVEGQTVAYPDTVVGTDSHTPMINGIGVMGWGVGGIEAEANMLGQPYYMPIPEVIGVKVIGELQPGVTATDMVLTVTEMLRKYGVVEKFVEYFGPGVRTLPVPERAIISNMTPEYGATLDLFPVDEKTLDYLRLTGRDERADVVEAYTKAVGLFNSGDIVPDYTDVLELDLSEVEPCVSGPKRPQDKIVVGSLKTKMREIVGKDEQAMARKHTIMLHDKEVKIGDASVVIAAITSCTNTSNPALLIGTGLLARNAVECGLKIPAYVKTSFAPGSKVVLDYLEKAGVVPYLDALGFHLVAFGCTTCIGNSGPLHPAVEKAITDHNLNVAAVVSGNRNFEARIHQMIQSNFLMSPMLVIAYALAGRVNIDLTTEPLALNPNGEAVYLQDIWPAPEEIMELAQKSVDREHFETEYAKVFDGDEFWHALPSTERTTFEWDEDSTYIKNPPFFENFPLETPQLSDITGARVMAVLGDSITTDHISPAGAIKPEYPAGQYLQAKHVKPEEFNSYGSRRGNHEVMMRGTFGNIRVKNKLVGSKEGSFTKKFPENEVMYIYDAAMKYMEESTPLLVLGGKEYGSGSSRDWAAKGTNLLGVKAVIAESYERIHRSNLVGMGVLPLVYQSGETAESLGLDGTEIYSISGIEGITPRERLQVKAVKADGVEITFEVIARLDTDVDVEYYQHGGILQYVLRKLMK
ncbi:aconitate hydratase AcnA [candidate division KSB3 bacterium]|uniref:Aconitate hydratase n=1 Tax=candidate division KSB3 bacterium TaxID=2044937 RepID=A0A2G6KM80_9BACT|nr:MAG: aconitate hydratase AcnA [candidate division KSB3 bacterium]